MPKVISERHGVLYRHLIDPAGTKVRPIAHSGNSRLGSGEGVTITLQRTVVQKTTWRVDVPAEHVAQFCAGVKDAVQQHFQASDLPEHLERLHVVVQEDVPHLPPATIPAAAAAAATAASAAPPIPPALLANDSSQPFAQKGLPPSCPHPLPPINHFPIERGIHKPSADDQPHAVRTAAATPPALPLFSGNVALDRPERFEDIFEQTLMIIQRIYHLPAESVADRKPQAEHKVKPAAGPEASPARIQAALLEQGNAVPPPTAKADAVRSWLNGVVAGATIDASGGGTAGLPVAGPDADSQYTGSPYEPTLVDGFHPKIAPGGSPLLKVGGDDDASVEIDRGSLFEGMPLRAWCQELLRRTDVSMNQLKVAACYLIAIHPKIDAILEQRRNASIAIQRNIPLPHFSASPLSCPRRTLLGALILAGKFINDRIYSNKAWARVTGLEAADLVQSEHAIGDSLKWRLWVGGDVQTLRKDPYQQRIIDMLSAPDGLSRLRRMPVEYAVGSRGVQPAGDQSDVRQSSGEFAATAAKEAQPSRAPFSFENDDRSVFGGNAQHSLNEPNQMVEAW